MNYYEHNDGAYRIRAGKYNDGQEFFEMWRVHPGTGTDTEKLIDVYGYPVFPEIERVRRNIELAIQAIWPNCINSKRLV
jgi:hypothetical protein